MTPCQWDGEVVPCRKGIREAVELKGGLVGEHAGLLGPEPERHELVFLSVGEVPETIDASTDPVDTAPTVVVQELSREPGCESVS
jgi:hypothetical protein